MNNKEAQIIIRNENLKNYNWYNDHNISPDEVSIMIVDAGWCVFTTDERASKVSEILYNTESEALIDFINRLRADKLYNSL